MDSFLHKRDFPQLMTALAEAGYRVLAPVVDDGVIRFQETDSIEPLKGLQVKQKPGSYRLKQSESNRYFNWAVGPEALKPLTFAPQEVLWQSTQQDGLSFTQHESPDKPTAIIGARACDLAAFNLQKQHFLNSDYQDHWFEQRTRELLIVAVECQTSAETCFCHSTGDGPAIKNDYDICLHELDEGYLIKVGTEAGCKIVEHLSTDEITDGLREIRSSQLAQAIAQQHRRLPAGNLYPALRAQHDADAWQDIARRCLSCGNCTAVCPTCFCHSQHDQIAPQGYAHVRQWDSCFNEQHSYIHGIVIRKDTSSRYRQWLTHKLGSWHEQYGRSGCVGCGRCIAWCPVGIDITETVKQVLGAAHAD